MAKGNDYNNAQEREYSTIVESTKLDWNVKLADVEYLYCYQLKFAGETLPSYWHVWATNYEQAVRDMLQCCKMFQPALYRKGMSKYNGSVEDAVADYLKSEPLYLNSLPLVAGIHLAAKVILIWNGEY